MKNRHQRKSLPLAMSGRAIGFVLIIATSIFASCIPSGTPFAPTSTAEIQYWLTPTQYSTQELLPTQTPIPALSTLDLIDQAYENGEITPNQRLLYLAYAFREYKSLPIQFHGEEEWGNNEVALHSREVHDVAENPTILCSINPIVRGEIVRLSQPYVTCEKPDPEQLSTPDLIWHAYVMGEISAEQRLLYLAYSIYGGGAIPVQFHGKRGWDGTFIVAEIHHAANNPSIFCPMSPEIRSEFQRLLDPKITCTASDIGVSTPELLEQAFIKGRITPERRLLYLAYAVYDPELLPVQFRGNRQLEEKSIVQELHETANDPSILCRMSLSVRSEIQRLVTPHISCKPFIPNQFLSTPALINQAVDNGEITEEQRLLYLAYGIFEYSSLPLQYRSKVEGRFSAELNEIVKAANDPANFCSMNQNIRNEIMRLFSGQDEHLTDVQCN